jgi:D-lactate dehydrogenase
MPQTKTKIFLYSAKPYDIESLATANQGFDFQIDGVEARLTEKTTALATGYDAVCAFVNDTLNREVLTALKGLGIRMIAMRCAGFNNVDLEAARELGLPVVRVPSYSPRAVAEHALALLMTLNRKTHKGYNRVRDGNFSLQGLTGFDVYGKTVGVIGTGKIGQAFAEIMRGLGCNVLLYDPYPNTEWAKALGLKYIDLKALYAKSNIISLHCPLTADNHHMISEDAIAQMKPGVFLINTGRGGLIDTAAVINGLKSGSIGAVGLDVYEGEKELFFDDHSDDVIHDDMFSRLITFPNVVITGHQAFLTEEALSNIATTTLENIQLVMDTGTCTNCV